MAAERNLIPELPEKELALGDHWAFAFSVKVDGEKLDLRGHTIYFGAKYDTDKPDSDAVFKGSVSVPNGPTAVYSIDVNITSAMTAGKTTGMTTFTVRLVNTLGQPVTVLRRPLSLVRSGIEDLS